MGKRKKRLTMARYAKKYARIREHINKLKNNIIEIVETAEATEVKVPNALKQIPPEGLFQVEEPAPTPAVEKTTKTTRKKSATTKKQPKTTKKRSTTPRKTRAKKETV